jgi:hypothetical protein
MGTAIMCVTGFMLFLPTLATRLLPGEAIPAAKLAHSSEGLMAFLVIIIWHIYNAHLKPSIFPMVSWSGLKSMKTKNDLESSS